jgi:hypothetical protein
LNYALAHVGGKKELVFEFTKEDLIEKEVVEEVIKEEKVYTKSSKRNKKNK